MTACYRRWLTSVLFVLATPALCLADDVRYYEQNGITYRETRQVVQQPLVETHLETRQQTVYLDQCKTQMQAVQRTYQTPVTDYVWEAFWANRWNPFEQPYIAYRYVPRVRWETHTETVQMPVTTHETVPQTQTVQVPVTTQRFVEGEVISRMPVSGKPADPFAQGTTSVARRDTSLVSPATPGPDATTRQ
ncbi:MAG TPA: hypothetical protein VHX65_19235 [Pirellulales bacterium]|jgi:hypothetical protein|nr:hypothetical protein [Pirellulales bacterium]